MTLDMLLSLFWGLVCRSFFSSPSLLSGSKKRIETWARARFHAFSPFQGAPSVGHYTPLGPGAHEGFLHFEGCDKTSHYLPTIVELRSFRGSAYRLFPRRPAEKTALGEALGELWSENSCSI